MADVMIEVEERDPIFIGKNGSRRLRRAGSIPAVLYGAGKPVVPVTVNPKALQSILGSEAGENTLLKLRLKGKGSERHAMIKDYQVDPVTTAVIHADLIRIELDEKITVSVPIHVRGVAAGVKDQGGTLEVVHRQVEVECLPGNIPEQIEVDVAALHIGDNVRVDGVDAGDRYQILDPPDTVLVTVVAPRAVEEVEATEEVTAVAEGDATDEAAGKDAGKDKGAEGDGDKSAK